MGKVRNAYTAKEKLAVVRYAEAHGNRAAGRDYGVGESSVRQWRKQKTRLQEMPKTKQANRGTAPHYPDVEKKTFDWVVERRAQGIGISTVEIRLQALIHARELGKADFKASVEWVYAFMRRCHLSIRRRTHIAQKLPVDHEEKLLEFQKFIIAKRRRYEFDLSQIGNADQTPLTFDLPYSRTVNMIGARSVSINTTGNEKNRFTVMLTCTADGGKLPPYVIFKRKTLPKGVKWPAGVIVRCQDNGWMDEPLTLDWLKTVWGKRPGGLTHRSMLVLDSFRCHKADSVKAALHRDYRTTLTIIPGGMTSLLQPLDVGVNKPMKTLLQRRWNKWYIEGSHTFTPAGRMRKPELEEICQWIVDAWAEIDPAIIVRSFKKCCISNSMDGTEDDVLWEDTVQPRPETDAEEDHDDHDDGIYTDCGRDMTDEEFVQLFMSDEEEDDFEGFESL